MRSFYLRYKGRAASNLLILALIVIIYLVLMNGSVRYTLSRMSGDPIRKAENAEGQVAFLCNVDWGEEYLPQMMEILESKGCSATFFLTGRWAEKNPDMVKTLEASDFEIGNHGYQHKNYSTLSRDANREQIQKAEDAIVAAGASPSKLFAPPSGDHGQQTLEAASALGYETILWSLDTIDWRDKDASVLVQRILKNPSDGDFILMHPTEQTVAALPQIIDGLQEKGFEIRCVSDLLPSS